MKRHFQLQFLINCLRIEFLVILLAIVSTLGLVVLNEKIFAQHMVVILGATVMMLGITILTALVVFIATILKQAVKQLNNAE